MRRKAKQKYRSPVVSYCDQNGIKSWALLIAAARNQEVLALRALERRTVENMLTADRIATYYCLRIARSFELPKNTFLVGSTDTALSQGHGIPPREVGDIPGAMTLFLSPDLLLKVAQHIGAKV